MSQGSSPTAVVVDSNVLISIYSKETSHSIAGQALADHAAKGSAFYAPGVVVAEVLFVLCRKLSDGTLIASAYDEAIDILKDYLAVMLQPAAWRHSLGPTSERDSDRLQLPSLC